MQGNHPESYSLQYSTPSLPHTIDGFNFPVQSITPVTIKITSPMCFTLPPTMLFLSLRSPHPLALINNNNLVIQVEVSGNEFGKERSERSSR